MRTILYVLTALSLLSFLIFRPHIALVFNLYDFTGYEWRHPKRIAAATRFEGMDTKGIVPVVSFLSDRSCLEAMKWGDASVTHKFFCKPQYRFFWGW